MSARDIQAHLHAEAPRPQKSMPLGVLNKIDHLHQFVHFTHESCHLCCIQILLRIEISFKEEGNMIAGFRFGMFRREILHTKEHVVETWPNCAKHTPSGNLPPSCDMWGQTQSSGRDAIHCVRTPTRTPSIRSPPARRKVLAVVLKIGVVRSGIEETVLKTHHWSDKKRSRYFCVMSRDKMTMCIDFCSRPKNKVLILTKNVVSDKSTYWRGVYHILKTLLINTVCISRIGKTD